MFYFFIDGVLKFTSAFDVNIRDASGTWNIGGDQTNQGHAGNLDMLRFVNGKALWDGSGYSVDDKVFAPPQRNSQ